MKIEIYACDNKDCKNKNVTFPRIEIRNAIIDVRSGVSTPMGFIRIEVENKTFCDLSCLESWLLQERTRVSPCMHVDIWTRKDNGEK